jgi:hypothetical protein
LFLDVAFNFIERWNTAYQTLPLYARAKLITRRYHLLVPLPDKVPSTEFLIRFFWLWKWSFDEIFYFYVINFSFSSTLWIISYLSQPQLSSSSICCSLELWSTTTWKLHLQSNFEYHQRSQILYLHWKSIFHFSYRHTHSKKQDCQSSLS